MGTVHSGIVRNGTDLVCMDNPQTEKAIPDRTNAGDGITVWDRRAACAAPLFSPFLKKFLKCPSFVTIQPVFLSKSKAPRTFIVLLQKFDDNITIHGRSNLLLQ